MTKEPDSINRLREFFSYNPLTGSFASEIEAAVAYNTFAEEHFGSFANLNKIFEVVP